ncbi:hypothetical protein B0H11DRAFT_768717 [Mycena galericulata]|nr:hypothetical protein B0H11DRAFT_768717 [Mycena galericulata]
MTRHPPLILSSSANRPRISHFWCRSSSAYCRPRHCIEPTPSPAIIHCSRCVDAMHQEKANGKSKLRRWRSSTEKRQPWKIRATPWPRSGAPYLVVIRPVPQPSAPTSRVVSRPVHYCPHPRMLAAGKLHYNPASAQKPQSRHPAKTTHVNTSPSSFLHRRPTPHICAHGSSGHHALLSGPSSPRLRGLRAVTASSAGAAEYNVLHLAFNLVANGSSMKYTTRPTADA